MIDSHCHLADKKFEHDIAEVIDRARDAGVEICVAIADSMEEAKACSKLAERFENVFFTAGVHPHNAKYFDQARDISELARFSNQSTCKAIGEIGLDYHYMNSPKNLQQAAFRSQLALAKELKLPAVVHTREALKDTWQIIDMIKPFKAVLHCCTEKWNDVETFVAAGYLLSFTGIVTYPKSQDIRETVKMCPLEKMMIETDAPYLSPETRRGQRNEPAFTREICAIIANVKGVSFEEVDRITTETTKQFYSL